MTNIVGEPKNDKFSEDSIQMGLEELAKLYEHDYRQPMPELRPLAGFTNDIEKERLGRLMGVVLKRPFVIKVPIDPTSSGTGSYFAYEFDEKKLKWADFAGSVHERIYAALLEAALLEDVKNLLVKEPDERLQEILNRVVAHQPSAKQGMDGGDGRG